MLWVTGEEGVVVEKVVEGVVVEKVVEGVEVVEEEEVEEVGRVVRPASSLFSYQEFSLEALVPD